jgi:hypothetical protein
MRSPLLQISPDCIPNKTNILQLGVPEAARPNVPRLQVLVTRGVPLAVFRKTMLTAIQFQIVSRLCAKEIQPVSADLMLAPEFVGGEPPVPQDGPQFLFRPSGLFPQAAAYGIGVHLQPV